MTTFLGLYGCTEKSITMPEDVNKIEYTVNDDFENYFLGEIHFIDDMNGWINCMGGQGLLKTSDGGNGWKYVYFDQETGPSAFTFINSNEGWFIRSLKGSAKIFVLHTTDAGKTWNELYFFNNEPSSPSYVSVDFINDSIGWITMSNGFTSTLKIFKTINGGMDWFLQKANSKETYIPYSDFINENTGWICTYTDIYKTTDGGGTWISQKENIPSVLELSSPALGKIDFFDKNTGFILRYGFELFRTNDGGDSWHRVITKYSLLPDRGQYSQSHCCYDFFNKDLGAIFGDSLYITQDGGNIWKYIYGKTSDDNSKITSICFASKNKLFAVDDKNSILKFVIR